MSSLIEDILGTGLRILLLGSYDSITRNILHNLRIDLNERFQRYSCSILLLENMDVFISPDPKVHDYSLFFEKGEKSMVVTIIKEKTKPVEIISYNSEEEFQKSLGSANINFNQFRKVSELEKVLILSDWADLIYLVKEVELTRGGEWVELTYLLHSHAGKSNVDPLKFELFYKKDLKISTMIKEIVANNKITPQVFDTYEKLRKLSIETTEKHISRLNTQIGRFTYFQ